MNCAVKQGSRQPVLVRVVRAAACGEDVGAGDVKNGSRREAKSVGMVADGVAMVLFVG